jgi:uncharacterized protein
VSIELEPVGKPAAEPPPDPLLDALVKVCDTLVAFDGEGDISWVDGYLTALAASRRHIATDEWLPALGGEAFERAFADPESASEATRALEAWLQRRRADLEPERLLDDSDRAFLHPLFDEWTEEDRQAIRDKGDADPEALEALHSGALWGAGFMAAVEDFADDWPSPADEDLGPDAEAYRMMTQLIACLTLGPQDPTYQAFVASQWRGAPPTRDELLDEVCFAVQDLRLYWLDHGPKPQQRRVGPTPGRNDPCPCGSGRKYKKCHGASA